MDRRDFLRALSMATFLAFLPKRVRAEDQDHTSYLPDVNVVARRPNIVLVMSDDQGWGDTGYNGHPVLQTPNLDAMAAQSLRFDRFYSAAPVCSPTRGSIMTARHPNRYHCYSWSYPLPTQEITLATLLKEAGYATGHFGKWHLGGVQRSSPNRPAAHGFDEYVSHHHHFDFNPRLFRDGVPEQFKGDGSMVVADEAIDFIRRHADGGKPFLAVVWFASCHTPHFATDEDQALYADLPLELRQFYGEITAMDRAFGKLRNELRTLGIQDDTILWFCSDNGGRDGISQNSARGCKEVLYEGGLLVPALLEWPSRILEPRITDIPVVTTDIMPTLLAIVGAEPPSNRPLDGVSITQLIAGRPFERPPIGFWYYHDGRYDSTGQTYPPLDAGTGWSTWLDWPWKLHKRELDDGTVEIDLYNLVDYPFESWSISDQEPQRVEDMLQALETWQASVLSSMRGEDYAAA
jgi:arylsulfatase A-like enzyme